MSRTIFTFLVFSISLLAQVTSIPGATGGGGGATASGYSAAVSAQTTLTVTAATHGQGTSPVAGCFDNSTPAVSVSCSYTRNTSGDVVFTWAPAFTGTVNIWAGAGTSGISGGGNLTTVGAIPYVSSSGVLNQDANLFWDSANARLRVGTSFGKAEIGSVVSGSTYPGIWLGNVTPSVSNYVFLWDTAAGTIVNAPSSAQYVAFRQNNVESARFAATTGNLLIGGTTDGGYKLGVQSSGTTGTVRIFDQTATTGSTLAVIQAGAGQGTNTLQEWRRNDGTILGSLTWSGGFSGREIVLNSGNNAFVAGTGYNVSYGLGFASTFPVAWSATTDGNSTKDLGLYRNAAGVLEINNGTAGTLRDLKLRNITVMDTTAVTGSTLAIVQAGAGQSGNLLSVRNNAGTELASITSAGALVLSTSTLTSVINASTSDAASTAMQLNATNVAYASSALYIPVTRAASSAFNFMDLRANGVQQFVVRGDGLVQFGGTTSSFPALKRSSATLESRLADDSGYAAFTALGFNGNYLTLGSGDAAITAAVAQFGSGYALSFSATAPYSGTKDSGLARAAAGYVKVTDGSTGLGKIVVSQSTPSASTDACTAGALWADATYIYACTASGTIKRATLASF